MTDSFPSLQKYNRIPDSQIDLAAAALDLAALSHPGISLDRYRQHLTRLAGDTKLRYDDLIAAGAADVPQTKLAALKDTICLAHEYNGDRYTYDDLQNADLMRVIDRRKGLPITLSILYIQAARTLGWDAHGLNVPGHFLVRLDQEGARIIFDPFNQCAVLQAPDLRRLIKNALGPQAELSATYFEAASNRAVLIRLQNNIKTRQIEGEDYHGALKTVEIMRIIDPGEFRLLLDAGVLYARTGKPDEAIKALEGYISLAPQGSDRNEAILFLQQIRESLS